MSVQGERVREWNTLPNILGNKKQRLHITNSKHEKIDSSRSLKLPTVQSNQSKAITLDTQRAVKPRKTFGKRRKIIYQDKANAEKSLEFVKIVNNPPLDVKFLSRTDVRVSQQKKHDVCERWLDHFAKSIQDEVAVTEKGLQYYFSGATLDRCRSQASEEYSEKDYFLERLTNLRSFTVNSSNSEEDEENNDQEDSEQSMSCYAYYSEQNFSTASSSFFGSHEEAKDRMDELNAKIERLYKEKIFKSLGRRFLLDNFEYLITQQIELEERKANRNKTNYELALKRSVSNSRLSLKTRKPNTAGTEKLGRDDARKLCFRLERSSKSLPSAKRSGSDELSLNLNTVQVYPFYEANWHPKTDSMLEARSYSAQQTVESMNGNFMKQFPICSRVLLDRSLVIKDQLKVTRIRLSTRNSKSSKKSILQEDTDKMSNPFTGKTYGVEFEARKENRAEPRDAITENQEKYLDLIKFNYNSLKEILSFLFHIAMKASDLTDEELLEIIQSKGLSFSNLMLLKQIITSFHSRDWLRQNEMDCCESENNIFKLLALLDRIEKIYREKGMLQERYCLSSKFSSGKVNFDLKVRGSNGEKKGEEDSEEEKPVSNHLRRRFFRVKTTKSRKNTPVKSGEEPIQNRSIKESVRGGSIELKEMKVKRPLYVYQKSDLPRLSSKFRQSKEKRAENGHMHDTEEGYKHADKNDYLYTANPPSSRNSFTSFYDNNSPNLSIIPSTSNEIFLAQTEWNGDLESKDKLSIEIPSKTQNCKENTKTRKLSEVLKRKVYLGLQNNFNLYPRLEKLLRIMNDDTDCRLDVQAAKETQIDYLAHFKLIDSTRLEMYCKAFAKVDKTGDGAIAIEGTLQALRFVDSLFSVPKKYIDYIFMVLDLSFLARISIKVFCLVCTILERMIEGGERSNCTLLAHSYNVLRYLFGIYQRDSDLIKDAVDDLNLMIVHEKLIWYKNMFYEAVDYDRNYINLETVKLELFAGGMDVKTEKEITERITRESDNMISFVDFLAYIPLFIAMHKKICLKTFDMKLS